MTAQALEQSMLESKDKEQLVAIAKALGLKPNARNKKSDIIGQILDMTGAGAAHAGPKAGPQTSNEAAPTPVESAAPFRPSSAPAVESAAVTYEEAKAEWELETEQASDVGSAPTAVPDRTRQSGDRQGGAPRNRNDGNRNDGNRNDGNRAPQNNNPNSRNLPAGQPSGGQGGDDELSRNSRRRRRRKGPRADGPQGEDRDMIAIEDDGGGPVSTEPLKVDGYVDLRDEGYGFLRIVNFLPDRADPYIPVKLARQYGLRKGDNVVAMSRAAGRNEKNPPVSEILTVNGRPPDEARNRRRFEDLTALFPDSQLRMEDASDPTNMTARIIDLICPIGKGQRGIIVSPPKAGKTTVMKTIATAVERNHPECRLMVLLIDERPEEVTDMRRAVSGEVISSTFDKPSDQHTLIAEMTIEKAKRMVEYGEDVVVILDGITRLSRAYNLAAPASGKILSGGIDAGALYPPKRFFGAARNIEEGGSLTILATALVETNSRMDEAVFEEFKGTGNMELRLDRRLAERRIYPAIDVDASSTRHEELLLDRKQLQMVWKLRRVLSGLAAEGSAAPGLELLVDRLKTFRTNEDFLTEIAKQPGM